MSATLEEQTEMSASHSDDPILERKSDLYGEVKVFPPNVPSSEWPTESFLLTTTKNCDNHAGLYVVLQAAHVWEAYQRPYLIRDEWLFDLD